MDHIFLILNKSISIEKRGCVVNIFVASWFFPPATSSEGIVTYKLLRNSRYQYDVFSSTSRQWGYKATMEFGDEKNIHCYTIATDDIDEWVKAGVEQFERLYPKQKYTCIMTRSMPPESILVGMQIKKKYPQVKWIASLGDPIANNPYEIKAYINDCQTLTEAEKTGLKAALWSTDEELLRLWEKRPEEGIRLMCKLKRWENLAVQQADMIIAPTGRQLRYMSGPRGWQPKYLVVPHSFDPGFYKKENNSVKDKLVFSFIGYSDTFLRSLEPFVRAVRYLKENQSPFLKRLDMRFIGNNPRAIQDMVLNYYLDDVIHFQEGVDYYQSLALMQGSDWLLHVDAFFPELTPGGSIFFAGKLADYMGAGKPIFALTGAGSPADEIVKKAGGVSVVPWETAGIANRLEEILSSAEEKPEINERYVTQYSADHAAALFDKKVEELCGLSCWEPRVRKWPQCRRSNPEKLMTICVPSYNVGRYLERCLRTLINHEYAADIEVLVVDDGSKDYTAQIAKAFEDRYPGIVRLIQKENGGHGSTINRAIKEGIGRYFMVVDGDDWVDSEQFEKLLAKIKIRQIDTDIISSNYHEINMETGICTLCEQQVQVEYFEAVPFEKLDLENIYFTLASTLIKLSVLRQVNQSLQEHTFYVDVEYILFPVPYLKDVTFVKYCIYKYCRGNTEQSVYIPTMVKRYDHHERVMKSVLKYKQEHPTSKAQRIYYNAILKRHLYTHYALFMVYDEDKKHGYEIGKRFDAFLRETDPELARWVAKSVPMVRIARRYGFDYDRVKRSLSVKLLHLKDRMKNKFKSSMKIRRLVYNHFTVRIGKMQFFTEGRGKAIKAKLRKFCGFKTV